MAQGLLIKTAVRVGLLGLVLVAGCEGGGKDTNMATIFGVGEDQNLVESPKPAKPKPTPTPTPPPPASPVPTDNAILKRNQAFDSLRSKAIAQVYQHDIDPAVATFNAAYRIKPNDRSVQLWLDAIKAGQEMRRKAAEASAPPGQFQNPTGANPAQGAGGPPGVPQVPPMPGANAPQSMPTTAAQIDPRLVF